NISVRLQSHATRPVAARKHGARDLQIVAHKAREPEIGALVCGEHALAAAALAQADLGRAVGEQPKDGRRGDEVLAIVGVRYSQPNAQHSVGPRLVDHFFGLAQRITRSSSASALSRRYFVITPSFRLRAESSAARRSCVIIGQSDPNRMRSCSWVFMNWR